MKSKNWHRDRIKELEFKRSKQILKNNRMHTTFIAISSLAALLIIFDLQKDLPNPGILLLGTVAFVLSILFSVIICIPTKERDEQIQHNYDALLDRENNLY